MQILSASEGNILEDESAISVITEAKTLGNEISLKQKVAEETEVQIEAARTAYKPCGDYTAILFFCISGADRLMYCADLSTAAKLDNACCYWLTHTACQNDC